MPAMIFSSVDLPEPFKPSTPILAPGKKLREMSFRIWRLGGTILPTRFMVKTYWDMEWTLWALRHTVWRRERVDYLCFTKNGLTA